MDPLNSQSELKEKGSKKEGKDVPGSTKRNLGHNHTERVAHKHA